ncbi:hypothetical protein CYMTET_4459 [Cymbomonas tetramitiformis]|uniref:Uncharacterized protein n=1 Tax=Cymbomonas tetramitiformis TaxID=36881 RepID=A0AAE0LKD8_9CHLO|nr:hypothetical protein CYMTET_4459 [Cymbomonas tetramitiformis]
MYQHSTTFNCSIIFAQLIAQTQTLFSKTMAFGYGDLAVSSFRSGMGPQMITADTAREFVDSAGQPAAHFQQRGADGAPG